MSKNKTQYMGIVVNYPPPLSEGITVRSREFEQMGIWSQNSLQVIREQMGMFAEKLCRMIENGNISCQMRQF